MPHRFLSILSISAVLVLSAQASAVTIHTWKDAAGVTHFSDEPSPVGTDSAVLELGDIAKPTRGENEDFYSIANQWKRLKAERDQSALRRLEKQKLQSAERERVAALQLQADSAPAGHPPTYPIYGQGFRPGFGNSQYRPGYGLPSFGLSRPGRDGRQARHPNYNSPFHDRVQPSSIRPKSSRNNARSGRQNYHGARPGAPRGRSQSGGSLFVRF